MFNKLEFSKLRASFSFAENRSGLMKSFGFSPSYSSFIQFLSGFKKDMSQPKLIELLDKQGYEVISVVVKKTDIALKTELEKKRVDQFEIFNDKMTEHARTFKFKPKKISQRNPGDTNLILKSLGDYMDTSSEIKALNKIKTFNEDGFNVQTNNIQKPNKLMFEEVT